MIAPFTAAEFGRIAERARTSDDIEARQERFDALMYAATLAGELERAKVDAERYRWITEQADGEPALMDVSVGIRLFLNRSEETIWMKHIKLGGTDLEVAIDDQIAAIKDRT